MGFTRDEGKPIKVIKARAYRPRCGICGKPIFTGELMIDKAVGLGKTSHVMPAHKDCYFGKRG